MKHHLLLIIHLLSAAIWVGGHLILTIRYLPKALKQKDASIIRKFEESYEIIGLPALLVLVGTGIWMASDYGVTPSHYFQFSNPIEIVVSIKLLLLFSTLLLAIHARLFIIPSLSSENLKLMAFHIVLITLIGVTMLILGTFVRFGGL
jgi:hypothetical protein